MLDLLLSAKPLSFYVWHHDVHDFSAETDL